MTRPRPFRGFSLLETMVVIAIIGVIAALAVPSLLPQIHRAQLEGGTESVAAFLARARAEAMLKKRCVRVYVSSLAADGQRVLRSEVLNTYDCDSTPTTSPAGWGGVGLDGATSVTSNPWLPLTTLKLEAKLMTVSFTAAGEVPPDTSVCNVGSSSGQPSGFSCGAFSNGYIVFRPNGRLWASTFARAKEDAVLTVTHTGLPAGDTRKVLVNSNGLICAYQRGQALIADAVSGVDFVCP